ncbi:MAG: hypothetical protein ACI4V3_01535 [Faecousia sp.]
MKKWLIIAVAIILVVLLTAGVFLCIRFISIYRETQETESTAQSLSIEEYAAQKLPEFVREYDRKTNTLTLSRVSSLSYEDACSIGGKVYVDELAPETYLNQARSIDLDITAQCRSGALTVVLCYLSTDGEPIFTVSSEGNIWTCWE